MVLEELKSKIAASLKLSQADFSYPPRPELGDLSLSGFSLAKEKKQDPVALARSLAEQLQSAADLKSYFSEFRVVGPYLNFFIKPEFIATRVLEDVRRLGSKYGENQIGAGRRVIIEYSNGNTHKEYHIGHMRNIVFGDAIYRLLAASGFQAIPVSYINDFGIHVAKTIWNWQRNSAYQGQSEDKGYLLGQCYAEASRQLEDNEVGRAEVGRLMKQIESRRGDSYILWKETRQWSISYLASIYKELKIKFNHIFYESEVIDQGLRLVDEFLAKGILKKSQGAIIADLESEGLGVLPVIRSDGTALYAVADLSLAHVKFQRYQPDESIYIVDVRQGLYFKQLFRILELAGFKQELRHLTYDFVTLPEGMMASRTGNVITYQYLRDKIVAKLTEETAKRHSDWSHSRVAKTAQALAMVTIKFEMLKVGPNKTIIFNIEEALRFDGYTACYLEYGYARLHSILRKAGRHFFAPTLNPHKLTDDKEKELLLKIAKYPKALRLARQNYDPSEVSKYLFELVRLSNDYYHEVNILKADQETRTARLALIRAVTQILANGFSILGLAALEEM